MKDETKRYGDEAYEIVNYAAKTVGSRLPGSDGEKKYADYMGEKLREIGIEPKQEEFFVSPRSSIGGLSYAGWVGVILSGLTYIALQLFGLFSVVSSTKHGLICSSTEKFLKTRTASLFPRTENMITQLFSPVIQTQVGHGATPSMHTNIRTTILQWV